MAKARLVALADEITDDLNKKSWSLAFKAKRVYKPNPKLEDTDQVVVLVVMVATRQAPDSRGEWVYEHDIDIGLLFRAKPDAGDAIAKFDECLKVAEELADHYRNRRVTDANMVLVAVQHGAGTGAPYIPEHINEDNQFTNVARLTFREWRT